MLMHAYTCNLVLGSKIVVPRMVTYLNHASIFKWYVVWSGPNRIC